MKKQLFSILLLINLPISLTWATDNISATEKLYRQEQIRLEQQAEYYSPSLLSPAINPISQTNLKLKKTFPANLITSGISDLGFGNGFIWALDGTSLDDMHYIDKIGMASKVIKKYFPAPNYSTTADGSQSIEYANNHLWVLNFLDKFIYKVKPSTGKILSFIPISGTDVTSGLGFDGTNLWYGEWDYYQKKGGALFRKVSITTGAVIDSFRIPQIDIVDDITFAKDNLWITGSKLSTHQYYILKVNPTTHSTEMFQKSPCEAGITFDGRRLWTSDWCRKTYNLYLIQ